MADDDEEGMADDDEEVINSVLRYGCGCHASYGDMDVDSEIACLDEFFSRG